MVAGRGTAACMAVSIEGTSLCPDGLVYCATNSILRWMQDLISTKATGTRNSSRAACSSHLPEALIHRTSSSFTEVFPEPACTSSGSRPKRAETSIRAWIKEVLDFIADSEWLIPDTFSAPCLRVSFSRRFKAIRMLWAREPLESPRTQYVIDVNCGDLRKTGTSSSGIGFASNNFRHGTASQRATLVAFCRLALSVEMPVFAYI